MTLSYKARRELMRDFYLSLKRVGIVPSSPIMVDLAVNWLKMINKYS
jgi:hypothetical protein